MYVPWYVKPWFTNSCRLLKANKVVLGGTFNDGNKTVVITRNAVVNILDLSCDDNEEADTRIIAYVQYIVISSGPS